MSDIIHAVIDGKEVKIYDHVSVSTHHYVNSVNGYETFEASIARGDIGRGPAPDYITERLGRLLHDEFGVEPEEKGIEVVDPDEVQLI